jgi:hypothetical protein
MVDDFGLLGCDKASYPTVMGYETKSNLNPSLPILTNGPHTDTDKNEY